MKVKGREITMAEGLLQTLADEEDAQLIGSVVGTVFCLKAR